MKQPEVARVDPENWNPAVEAAKKPVAPKLPIEMVEAYLSYYYAFRNNQVSGKIECRPYEGGDWMEANESQLLRELLKEGVKANDALLVTVLKSDYVKPYNAIQAYFEELPAWQPGMPDHIGQLSSYVKAEEPERWNVQFRKHLVRMVACGLGQEFNKQCLVLVGSQNDGKSSFMRFLCPPALAEHITEHYDVADKDSQIALAANFIINLDELASFTRKDINQIKAHLSLDKVNVRPPYGRRTVTRRRIANFLGSTNEEGFLTDATGSVRWLCFREEGIDFAYSQEVNIDLVWSQAYALYKSGMNYKMNKQELAQNEASNESFQQASAEADLVAKYFAPDPISHSASFRTATDVLLYLSAKTTVKLGLVAVGRGCALIHGKRKGQRQGEKVVFGYYLLEKF